MELSISRPFGKDLGKYLDMLEDAGFHPEAGKPDMDGDIVLATIELESLEDLFRLQELVGHPLVIRSEWYDDGDIVIEDTFRY